VVVTQRDWCFQGASVLFAGYFCYQPQLPAWLTTLLITWFCAS